MRPEQEDRLQTSKLQSKALYILSLEKINGPEKKCSRGPSFLKISVQGLVPP